MELLNTVAFFVLFTLFLLPYTFGLLFAFLLALGGAAAIENFVTNKKLPVPRQTALVITGCSTGIGADATLRFASQGITVFAGVRRERDAVSLRARAQAMTPPCDDRVVPLILDVTNASQVSAAVALVTSRLKSDDLTLLGLINNAGYSETCPLELLTLDKLKFQFDVNVFGVVEVTKAFLPLLRTGSLAQSRRLVFISSGVGKIAFPACGAYCATKHAVEAIGDVFRQELQSWNIDVSIIEPGAIATEFSTAFKRTAEENFAAARQSASGGEKKEENKDVATGSAAAVPAATESATAATATATATATPAAAAAPSEAGIVCGADVIARYQAMHKARNDPKRGHVSQVTDEIELALFHTKPHTRYLAGKDVKFGLSLLTKLPDRLKDIVGGSGPWAKAPKA